MVFMCTLKEIMYIKIDHNSGVPISAQMVDQITYLVVSGALETNEKIPSVRSLASELKLNPTTVARVYRQLEADGVIYAQRGKGSFISVRRSGLTEEEKRRRLAGDVRALVLEAGRLDLEPDALLQMIQHEMDELHGAPARERDADITRGEDLE
jgi:GntR family transcriptional regulator